ncbi:MAG: elongation factor P [Blastochloris viridis]|uniref:Elongation factor P n=1 Tax=Blastochloris viridis TaxID=1079 RepID=A0A6N4RDY5_BLAVI|nr:MAG: elongation factor P [Blastochloris viridis]
MKISGVDIRPGMVLDYQNKLWRVAKIQHTQPGKGGAYMQVEMKAIIEGTKLNERFRSADTVEKASLEGRPMQYLFAEGNNLTFMDMSNYEQTVIDADLLGDQMQWLSENMEVQVDFYGDRPVSVSVPEKMEFEVVEADAVVKGQTASSSYKPAKLSNGARILVPPYLGAGERIIVNTTDGSFVSRA